MIGRGHQGRTDGSKYHAVKTEVDGIVFASKKEAKRGKELRLLQKAGEITELKEQVKFTLVPRQDDKSGKCIFRAVTYTLDYQYRDRDGVMRYEDVKGYANDRWPMKRALMLWIHDILVEEV